VVGLSAMNDSATAKPVDLGSKRALILREAARDLNRRGVTGTSLADVAGGVGVTRAALYYYFDDQEDLVFRCYSRTCEVMAQKLAEASSGRQDAVGIIAAFIDGLLDPDEPELAVLSDVAYLGDVHRTTLVGLYESLIDQFAAILQRGVERGEVRDCDRRLAAMLVLGLTSWVPLHQRWSFSASFSHASLVESVKTLLFDGLAADRASPMDYEPLILGPADIPQSRVFDGAALALAKQEALLAAASWLFNLKGANVTTLEEIAARVGVTKKVIYHNIGDKQALVAACYLRTLAFATALAERAGDCEGPRALAYARLMHAHAEARLREDIAPLSGLVGLDALPQPARGAMNEAVDHLVDVAAALFRAGQADGSLRDLDIGPLMAVVAGVVEWIPKWLSGASPARRGEIASELAMLCMVGLRSV
jgi:AcrR family transcriptional regulator